jgi:two-component system, NtrC family, response regulator HydG
MPMKTPPDEVATALTQRESAPMVDAYDLIVIEGPDRGLTVRLDASLPPRILVGQSPSCNVRLTDGRVSRRHLALDMTKGHLRLTDLGSTNGTTVNGVGVIEAVLRGDELVRVGDSAFRVDRVGDAPPVNISTATSFGSVLGASLEMRRLYSTCARLAAVDVPLLIEGETGTGKEVLAESIHEASPRTAAPFVVLDCTAVPPNLIESELFGHEKGAFTGAVSAREGVFEQAHQGTLFIDEIGDLPAALQPKLLRAIERQEVRRVGGDWVKVDVRVVAATRRDLDREVHLGSFRDDLFYRLAVARVELPPLRERQGDIAFLSREFWQRLGGRGEVPYELIERFERYDWPGNVRELHNAVLRQLAVGEALERKPASSKGARGSSDAIAEVLAQNLPFPRARDLALAEFERRYVEHVLAQHGGVVSRAAAASGIARRYFNILRARSRG